jgi:hypothetical protein
MKNLKIWFTNLLDPKHRTLTDKEIDSLLNFGSEAGVKGRAGGRGSK